MKNFELMSLLAKKPAGAEIKVCATLTESNITLIDETEEDGRLYEVSFAVEEIVSANDDLIYLAG